MENIKTSNIKNIKAVIIDNSLDENVNSKNCVSELLIEYEDGKAEILDSDLEDIEKREELTKLFNRCCRDSSLKINIGKVETNGTTQQVLQDSENIQLYKVSDAKRLEEYDEAVGNYENLKQHSKVKKYMTMAGIALGAAAIAAGCKASQMEKTDDTVIEEEQETVEEIVKPDMEGQEWDYYVENAIDSIQKESWSTVGDFLLSFNNSQEWMERTNENGEFSRFGFTPEEAMSTYLRFNEFTDEELITIFNGTNINADEIMNLSNDFLEEMQIYYSVSTQPSGISSLFNDEHDKEVVEAFEQQWSKVMNSEGKEQETQMKELKEMFKDYFNSDVDGKEIKARQGSTSYLLRTMLPAMQKISDVKNYKDTMLIYKTGSGESVEVKADLFDEVFMSRYVQGFDNFDEEHFLKQLGYNPDKYYVGIDGEKASIADLSCGEQEQKFRDADEYKVTLETSEKVVSDNKKALEAELTVYVDKDGKIDADKVAEAIDHMNFDSEEATIAELTKYSYEPSLIADMLSKKLETLEKNAINANTFHEYFLEILLKDELSNTKTTGTVSSKTSGGQVLAKTTNRTEAKDALMKAGDSAAVAEAKIVAAEEEAAKKVGAERDTEETKQKHEEIAKKDMANKQEVYDKTFSYYANGGTGEYRSDWSNSSDADVREVYSLGKQDGINNLSTTVYNSTYSYYLNGGTGEYNGSYASSSNSTIIDAYTRGKQDGLDQYKILQASREQEKENSKPLPTVAPKPTEEPTSTPTPEATPAPTEAPVETPTPSGDYAPIVDEPAEPSQTPEIWDDDKLIEQFSLDNVEAYSSDFSSMDVYANDLVQEESTQKTL